MSQRKVRGVDVFTGFLESKFSSTHKGRYEHSDLSSLMWWDTMQYVLKGWSLCMPSFVLQTKLCIDEYESLLHEYPSDLEQYMRVIKPKMGDISNSTFVNVGTCNFHTCNPNAKQK
jgi:hypothetical protein